MLSVIVPVLNDAPALQRLLRDLAPLREWGCEFIIVDGGSTDGVGKVCERFGARLIQSSAGRGTQLAAGAAGAGGAVLWFLHADTGIPATACEQVRVLASREDWSWARFDIRLSGERGVFRLIERMINLRSHWTGIATGDQGMLLRRTAYRRADGFPDWPLMEDLELSRRLRSFARPLILRPPLLTSSRRWERQGVLRTILLMWRLRAAFFLGVSPHRLAARYPRCT